MPDVAIEKKVTLDILDLKSPALSATSDMPVIETKPDASPKESKEVPPAEEKPAPTAEVPEGTKPAESAPAEQPDDPTAEPEPKKAKGVQKRIDELTRQREDERRRAEAAEARLDRALAALEKNTGVSAKDTKQILDESDPEPVKPTKDPNNPEAYDDALERYILEKSSWITRREVKASLAEVEKSRKDEELASHIKTMQDSYKSKVEKAREKYADYSEIAESPDVMVSPIMAQGIFSMDDGPEIAYHLGKNPAEAERISKLPPQVQLMELGKISARLATPPQEKPKISSAPKPGTPIKPTPEAKVSVEEESMEVYAARRKKELAAERKGARA